MKNTKAVNYTPDMIEHLKAGYTGENNQEEINKLSNELGRKPASIIAKLSSMQVYKKAETVKGAKVVKDTKAKKAARIGLVVGLTDLQTETLTSASVSTLDVIEAYVTPPQEEGSE